MDSRRIFSPGGRDPARRSPDEGVERPRSIFSATRSALSNGSTTRSAGSPAERETLLRRLPDARLALRYEAILDVFSHIGKDVTVREYYDYATAGLPAVFAAVRPGENGAFEIGVALSSSEHEELVPCLGEWPHHSILSKFTLRDNETLSGHHLRFIRLASRAISKLI